MIMVIDVILSMVGIEVMLMITTMLMLIMLMMTMMTMKDSSSGPGRAPFHSGRVHFGRVCEQ